MASWRNQQDIEFIFRREPSGNARWTERRCGVQSIAGNLVTMKQPGWAQCIGAVVIRTSGVVPTILKMPMNSSISRVNGTWTELRACSTISPSRENPWQQRALSLQCWKRWCPLPAPLIIRFRTSSSKASPSPMRPFCAPAPIWVAGTGRLLHGGQAYGRAAHARQCLHPGSAEFSL